jgi:hypothetical protein
MVNKLCSSQKRRRTFTIQAAAEPFFCCFPRSEAENINSMRECVCLSGHWRVCIWSERFSQVTCFWVQNKLKKYVPQKSLFFTPQHHQRPEKKQRQLNHMFQYFFLNFLCSFSLQSRDVMRNSLNAVLAMTRRARYVGVRECAIRWRVF